MAHGEIDGEFPASFGLLAKSALAAQSAVIALDVVTPGDYPRREYACQ